MKKIKLFDAMSDDYIMNMDVDGYSEVKYNAGVKIDANGRYIPVPGGLYDPAIFGKAFFDPRQKYFGGVRKCSCGSQRSIGRCGTCHEILLGMKDYITKGGYYSFCVPFVGLLKDDKFFDSINEFVDFSVINGIKKAYNVTTLEAIWCCEFIPIRVPDYKGLDNVVKYKGAYYKIETRESTEESSFNRCGLTGIMSILKSYEALKGNSFREALKYINQNLYIAPVNMRPVGKGFDGLPVYPNLTQAYSMVIKLDQIARGVIYGKGGTEGKLIDKLALASNINTAINLLCQNNLALLKSSKQSLIRYHGTGRVPCSFRANIISARTSMDTVLLPRAIAYEAVKGDLLRRLEVECYNTNNDPLDLYMNPTERVNEIFESLIENSTVILGRQPTLYKYGQLAFKCRLWKESDFNHPINVNKISAIGMNVVVCSPFNADFDGDQMYGIIFTTSPDKEEVWRKAGVAFNWTYQKNNESVFVPKKEILAGLHVGTKLIYSNQPIPDIYKFKSYTTVFRLYNNKQLMFNTPIELNGEVTTFGILRVSDILHKDLKSILLVDSNDKIDINSKTMKLISAHITTQSDRVDMVSALMDCGDAWVKQYGSSLIRLSELYKVDTNFPEIEDILKSKRSEKEKMILLDKLLSDVIKKGIKNTLPSLAQKMPGLVDEMGISGIKPASVVSMVQPIITSTGSGFKVSNRSLLAGYGEEEFVNHAATTREILKEKGVLVPIGGYINKCVTDALSNFIFKANETSTDVVGIPVRKCDAAGRYDINGNLIGTTDDESIIRVKSCIYSKGEYKYHVASDELNRDLYKQDNNGVIGIEAGNAATEEIIQSQLALKHGGKLFSPSLECVQIHEPLSVVEIADDYIVLGRGTDRIIYPLPEKIVFSKETLDNNLKAEDVVFYIDENQYVDYNIKRIGSVIGFIFGSSNEYNPSATKYKSNKCISPVTGTIHYDFNKKKVRIGSLSLPLNKDVVYYYPEGSIINQYSQFCSGTISPKDILSMSNNIEVQFGLFYTQIKKLMPKLQLLSIELLFKSLFIFGNGTIKSAIASEPFQLMKNQKATSIIKANLGREFDLSLEMDMVLGLNMRDEI